MGPLLLAGNLAEDRSVYVVLLPEKAGRAMVSLYVHDLDERLARGCPGASARRPRKSTTTVFAASCSWTRTATSSCSAASRLTRADTCTCVIQRTGSPTSANSPWSPADCLVGALMTPTLEDDDVGARFRLQLGDDLGGRAARIEGDESEQRRPAIDDGEEVGAAER